MQPIQQIEKELRERIIEVVPGLIVDRFDGASGNISQEVGSISLADVLIAYRKRGNMEEPTIFMGCYDTSADSDIYYELVCELLDVWDLAKDLDGQSEEVKRFIHEVICK